MKASIAYYVILSITAATYFTASKYIFDEINSTAQIVVDELFHIPQGLAYCHGNYSYWNPKITTLPGLYFISTLFLEKYFGCSTYNLRFVNLIVSCVNLFLFASILKFIYGYKDNQLKIVLQALNLAILPPLYFFSHLYYTDTLSLTFLLAFSRLCFTYQYKLFIFLLGTYSVIMRQTNIMWVALLFGHKAMDVLIRTSRVFGNRRLIYIALAPNSRIAQDIDKSKLKRYYNFHDFITALIYHLKTGFTTFFKLLTLQDFGILFIHGMILALFSVFVLWNGSIVVGDKKAHEATLNLPQIFYFLLFYGIFGLPYVLSKLLSTIKLIIQNKFRILSLTALFLLIVHFNTVIHPYLLADNRHYTFYVWNRWYGKYNFAIYATVPIYVFLLASLYDNIRDQNCITFLLPYTVCTCLLLALQKMIEVRYFLFPYIILRLRFRKTSLFIVLFEFVWYIVLNIVTFHLFFTKEIMWKDFDEVQRIIW